MGMVDFVSNTSYSLSQNWPKESSALFYISGKMCDFLAASGNCRKSSRAVRDDVITAPSGCFTYIPFLQGITCVQGDEVQM